MAQSCMKKVLVPVATFASCGGASALELYFVVWEVVGKLALFDIHVRGIVCDGAVDHSEYDPLYKIRPASIRLMCCNLSKTHYSW